MVRQGSAQAHLLVGTSPPSRCRPWVVEAGEALLSSVRPRAMLSTTRPLCRAVRCEHRVLWLLNRHAAIRDWVCGVLLARRQAVWAAVPSPALHWCACVERPRTGHLNLAISKPTECSTERW
jgi:hypothetical protein